MHRTRPVRRHAAAARVAAILLPTALVLAAFYWLGLRDK